MITPVKFRKRSDFFSDLKKTVDRYFAMTKRSRHATADLYVKAVTLMLWLAASYIVLVFFATAWWQAMLLAMSIGLAMAGIGFCIQHDGNHQAFSKHRWINRLAAFSLDAIGGSSYVWTHKHNIVHHTYTNIAEHDDDINTGILGRLAPTQPRLWFHRVQHIYLWFVYGLVPVKWQLFDDFLNVIRGRIGKYPFARPRGVHLATFIGGKLLFYTWAFVIPSLFHPFWQVVLVYLFASWCMGVVLAVVFQLAHVVEETKFPLPDPEQGAMENAWAEHQVLTTANFAPKNKVLTWFLGGLNYQIEHHLFPRISHIHYPKICRLVRRVCKRHELTYHSHDTMWLAIVSHYRLLRSLGKPQT
ncbi:MAG: acyl-CoA desaturase [Patescibacteria group bacterium]